MFPECLWAAFRSPRGFAAVGVLLVAGTSYAGPDIVPASLDTAAVVSDSQSLAISGDLGVTLTNSGDADIATAFDVLAFEDRNGNGRFDGPDSVLGIASLDGGLVAGASGALAVPVSGGVQFAGNLIYVFADSGNVVAEGDETNNLRNTGQSSQFIPTPGPFAPVLEWSWTPANAVVLPDAANIMNTPAVIDLTGDGIPEVIFGSTASRGGGLVEVGYLRALDGADGSELFTVTDPDYRVNTASSMAAADIDGDGRPEIVAAHYSNNRFIAFEHDGTFKWLGEPGLFVGTGWGAVTIADLDQDGTPEILAGRQAMDNQGNLLWTGNDGQGNGTAGLGGMSLVADVDLDGSPEVIAGRAIYDNTGAIEAQLAGVGDGPNAIGDFDDDDFAEIVIVYSGRVYLYNHDGSLIWGGAVVPGGGAGGPPTIADYDSDGEPEIGVAGASRYAVFETDGTLRWAAVTQDGSSNRTGSSVFDFDGDGSAEVVYRDERFLRVYRGATGEVLFETPMSSCTWHEYINVADVDADGNAEIIAVANDNCGFGAQRGVFIFGDANDNWVPTRKIWNQHTYHITNVNADGSVPAVESNNWQVEGLNNYRLNEFLPGEGTSADAPDLVPSFLRFDEAFCPERVTVTARVGNGGSLLAPGGIEVAFYDGDPADGGTLLGTVPTTLNLEPGQFEDVSVVWNAPPAGIANIHVVADASGLINEGDESNNSTDASATLCSPVCIENLSVRPKTGKIQLVWTHVGGAVYDVLRGGSIDGPFGQIASTDSTYATYLDTPVDNGVLYYYRIRRLPGNLGEESCLSDVIAAVAPDGRRTRLVRVPDLLEQPQAAAEATLAGASLALGDVRQVASDSIPQGLVAAQDPPDGSVVPLGFPVALDISAGAGGSQNTPPTVDAGADTTVDEGDTFVGAGSFVDPDTDTWTGSVDYGDGSGVAGLFLTAAKTFDLSHVYVEDGEYTVTVSVNDGAGAVNDTVVVTVLNSSPVVEAGADRSIKAGESAALDPATFTDDGVTDTHTASIDWGDGTVEPGAVTQAAGGGTVAGSHTYPDSGDYTVTVTVRDDEDAAGNDTFVVSVDSVRVAVPDVVGATRAAAEGAIGAAQLSVGTVLTVFSDTVPEGEVISQDPAGGNLVVPGTSVDLTVSEGPEPIVVPDVVGLAQAAAESAIVSAGLGIDAVSTSYSNAVPEGDVISQDPPGGSTVDPGTSVDLIVSDGPEPVSVPNVVGQTQASAESAIVSAGLAVGAVGTAASDIVPEGDVISQDPSAGASVDPGTPIDLFVSSGRAPVIVPDVVGQSQAAAATAVTGAGLSVGAVSTANSLTVPAGSVISQSPVGGSSVASGSAVDLEVSLGPVQVAVPDVVGLAQGAAESAITGAGLAVGTVSSQNSDTVPSGDVIGQDPLPGTSVDEGSAVALVVSVGPADVAVPDVVGSPQAAAEGAITAAGLTVGAVTTEQSSTVPAGEVISQNPPAGTLVGPGTSVSITISEGAAQDDKPPLLAAAFSREPPLYVVGESARVDITASDNSGSVDVTMTVDGAAVAVTLPSTSIATDGFAAGSSHTVVVTAADAAGNSAGETLVFAMRDPADATAPTVSISSPSADAEVVFIEDVIGTASDANLFRYDVSLSRISDPGFFEVFADTTSVTNGVLGQLDATVLENGMYTMRLTATDTNGLSSSIARTVRIAGTAKIGRLRLSFTDLNVPVAGVPIRITRTYDSTVRTTRDFGVGWTLEIDRGSIENNRLPGDGWQILSGGFLGLTPCVTVNELLSHVTEVRLSDREFYLFRPRLNVTSSSAGGCQGTVSYTLVNGSRPGATLGIIGDNRFIYQNGFSQIADFGGSLFNPETFRLRTIDGRVFDLSRTAGLTRLQDRNGNSLTISSAGITHSAGRSIQFTRDGQGRLIAIEDPAGEILSYGYDAAGELVSFIDRELNEQQFIYEDHLLLEIRDGSGVPILINEFDAAGRLIATTDAEGLTSRFEHDLTGRQEIIEDENGNRSFVDYDDDGRILSQTDATGVTTRYEYDGDGNRTKVIFHDTVEASYEYGDGYVTAATDNRGNRWEYDRDAAGRIQVIRDPLLNETLYDYDANGNLTRVTNAALNTREFTYDAQGNVVTRKDENGRITTFDYDGFGNLTGVTRPDTSVVEASYDPLGLLRSTTLTQTTATGPRTIVTGYAYDGNGQIRSVQGPDGLDIGIEHDEFGSVSALINSNGERTGIVADAAGRTRQIDLPDGSSVAMDYRADGQLDRAVSRRGIVHDYDYDPAGRPLSMTGQIGGETVSGVEYEYDLQGRVARVAGPGQLPLSITYDASDRINGFSVDHGAGIASFARNYDELGRLASQTDHLGRTTGYAYDELGRLITITFPDLKTIEYEYDPVGNLVLTRDRSGNATVYEYDELDRLTLVRDALGNETVYDYDEFGNLTSAWDGENNETLYEYDSRGRRTALILPGGERAEFTYDSVGNLATMRDFNGDLTSFDYDSSNRLVLQTLPGGATIEYTYGAAGELASVLEARGETAYAYSPLGQLLRRTEPDGEQILYAYDNEGRLVRTTTASGSVDYAYSDFGQLETVTDPRGGITRYVYDGFGRLAETAYPNGFTETRDYDDLDRITRLTMTDAAATAVLRYDYQYDDYGNVTRVDELDGRVVEYAYDGVNRLSSERVTGSGGAVRTITYDYDANWNRTEKNDSATGLTAYDYDENGQLLRETSPAGVVTYQYDDAGRLLMKSAPGRTESYTWDARNRLIDASVTEAGTTVDVVYAYDHEGNRTARVVDGDEVRFLVDTNRRLPQVIREYTATGAEIASYVYGDELLQRISPLGDRLLFDDLHSGIRRATDRTGTTVAELDYDAFGADAGVVGDASDYRYRGEALDPVTGNYYLRNRHYDPASGRFLSRDAFQGSTDAPVTRNTYLYGNSNPVLYVDPTGLSGDISLPSVIQANQIRIAIMTIGLVVGGAQQIYAEIQESRFGKVLFDGSFYSLGIIHPMRAAGKIVSKPGFTNVYNQRSLEQSLPPFYGFETQLAFANLESQCFAINREPLQYGQQDWLVLWGLTGVGAGLPVSATASDISMNAPANFGVDTWYTFDGGGAIFNIAFESSLALGAADLFGIQSTFAENYLDVSATGVWAGFASGTTSNTRGLDWGVDIVAGLSVGFRWGELDTQCVPERK